MKHPLMLPGRFVRRDNRFRATVVVRGAEAPAHIANSGRLTELLVPGRLVWLTPMDRPGRVTSYDLKLVEYGGLLVSIDARMPNPLFEEALRTGVATDWEHDRIEREVVRGESRLDFRLSGPEGVCWVETKSVTLVEDGVALFPDAPTARGRRHTFELIEAVRSGEGAAVVFVVQREDPIRFAPCREADPSLADALHQAHEAGVQVLAYRCRVTLQSIEISRRIPVVGL